MSMINVKYEANGKSTVPDALGMREMQARAYAQRNTQYLLLKAPPASGKSRALMFLALDKLYHQGVRKAIVAVPERSIGSSFKDTDLSTDGFFADWSVQPRYNLCGPDAETGKIRTFRAFLDDPEAMTLVCTHSTLRHAFNKIPELKAFDDTLVGIDEFHHVSADEDSRLGQVLDALMQQTSAHIVAMTGSYFRGDGIPILIEDDEAQFNLVTYTYYDQLNGYRYLKSIGIDYHFYTGDYGSAITQVLDTRKKTIIHIPNVNSAEAAYEKREAVFRVLDKVGEVVETLGDSNVMTYKTEDGRFLKVANLVEDDPRSRSETLAYLQNIDSPDQMDIIIALGMAKEGFDWPWCEHVLTIGYRESLTEVVQIIGRATRDAEGKTHAQFTNMIAMPEGTDDDRHIAVNDLLKAITASLLMEQILAPNIKFKPRSRMTAGDAHDSSVVLIDDTDNPVSNRCAELLEGDASDLLQKLRERHHDTLATAITGDDGSTQMIHQAQLPGLIRSQNPDLTESEVDLVTSTLWARIAAASNGGLISEQDLPEDAAFGDDTDPNSINRPTAGEPENQADQSESGEGLDNPDEPKPKAEWEEDSDSPGGQGGRAAINRKFISVSGKFINIQNLNLDLIDSINPFEGGESILSKALTPGRLRAIRDRLSQPRSGMTEQEAVMLWPRIQDFVREYRVNPSMDSDDSYEVRLAQALQFLRDRKREKQAEAKNAQGD